MNHKPICIALLALLLAACHDDSSPKHVEGDLTLSTATEGWTFMSIETGNIIGTWCVAFLERQTRIGAAMTERAAAMCEVKFSDSLLSVFILAIFCNILIYRNFHPFLMS